MLLRRQRPGNPPVAGLSIRQWFAIRYDRLSGASACTA
jgi:hypothetical protein